MKNEMNQGRPSPSSSAQPHDQSSCGQRRRCHREQRLSVLMLAAVLAIRPASQAAIVNAPPAAPPHMCRQRTPVVAPHMRVDKLQLSSRKPRRAIAEDTRQNLHTVAPPTARPIALAVCEKAEREKELT